MFKPITVTATVTAAEMAEHEGLVRWVVRRQRLRGLPFEDAVHEGRIGLWRAIQGYDPRRGTRFSTYAVVAIKRSIWEAVDLHLKSGSPFAALSVADPSEPLDLSERLAVLEAREELSELIPSLPRHLREIVVRHHGLRGHLPESFTAIGLSFGASASSTSTSRRSLSSLSQIARSDCVGSSSATPVATIKRLSRESITRHGAIGAIGAIGGPSETPRIADLGLDLRPDLGLDLGPESSTQPDRWSATDESDRAERRRQAGSAPAPPSDLVSSGAVG